jgi:hypothetical protein
MDPARRTVALLLKIGLLPLLALGSVGGLWAFLDTKAATRTLGSKFVYVGIAEAVVTLYALQKLSTPVSRPGQETRREPNYSSHAFRK